METRWRTLLNLGLAALAAVAAALLLSNLFSSPKAPAQTSRARSAGQAAKSRSAAPPRTGHIFQPVGRAAGPATAPRMNITILGVVAGPKGAFILARSGGSDVLRVEVGGSLGPYIVKEIRPDAVIFTKGRGGPRREVRWQRHMDYLLGPEQGPETPPRPKTPAAR